jgi:hypothetical protein
MYSEKIGHYNVTFSSKKIMIGCESRPIEYWEKMTPDKAKTLDGLGGEWWLEYGKYVLDKFYLLKDNN